RSRREMRDSLETHLAALHPHEQESGQRLLRAIFHRKLSFAPRTHGQWHREIPHATIEKKLLLLTFVFAGRHAHRRGVGFPSRVIATLARFARKLHLTSRSYFDVVPDQPINRRATRLRIPFGHPSFREIDTNRRRHLAVGVEVQYRRLQADEHIRQSSLDVPFSVVDESREIVVIGIELQVSPIRSREGTQRPPFVNDESFARIRLRRYVRLASAHGDGRDAAAEHHRGYHEHSPIGHGRSSNKRKETWRHCP